MTFVDIGVPLMRALARWSHTCDGEAATSAIRGTSLAATTRNIVTV